MTRQLPLVSAICKLNELQPVCKQKRFGGSKLSGNGTHNES